MLEYQEKVVQDVAACTCDRCQRRMTPDDHPDWEEKLSVSFSTGYDSIFGDGNEVEIDLCPQCVKETLGAWLRFSQSDWAKVGAGMERGITDSDAGSGMAADEVFEHDRATDEERAQFHADLLEGIRDMKAGRAARVTRVEPTAASVARAKVGRSQSEFELAKQLSEKGVDVEDIASEFNAIRKPSKGTR